MNAHPEQFELFDLADGEVAPQRMRALEQHVGDCQQCREELETVRSLKSNLSGLPLSIEPVKPLWPAIRARIESKADRSVDFLPLIGRRRRTQALVALGFAAMLVVGVLAVALPWSESSSSGIAGHPTAMRGCAAQTDLASARGIDSELVELAAALDARRLMLKPQTENVIDENLRIIDEAIARSKAALAADPDSGDLMFQLCSVFETKIELLTTATEVATRTPDRI